MVRTAPLLSLAAGVLPEFSPEQTVAAAIEGGWQATGIWYDPETWTPATTVDVRDRAADAGLAILDIEVIWLKPGADDPAHFAAIDAGAAIGARNVLIVSSDDEAGRAAAKLNRLGNHAAAAGLRACLEFAAFTTVGSIESAVALIDAADCNNLGLLIDPLHLARTGGSPADLAEVDQQRFPYAQFCDASAHGPPPSNVPEIIREALDLRLMPGDGRLPLDELIAALPSATPLSIELRSAALRENHPDPAGRARALLAATQRWFAA